MELIPKLHIQIFLFHHERMLRSLLKLKRCILLPSKVRGFRLFAYTPFKGWEKCFELVKVFFWPPDNHRRIMVK